MNKRIIPLMILPLFLFGCGKDKNVYASSKNTIYKFELEGNDVVITGLNRNYKNQTDIIIPYSIDKHVVKRIEGSSFEDVYRIKKVDMSKSKLTEIGSKAFRKCTNLTEILYNETLTTIDNNAFEECTGLVTMDLSKTKIETISDNMFYKCENLTTVTFPKTVKTLGSNIFSGCDAITSLDYSDLEIEKLSDYALYNLSNLKEVKLSKTTKEIGNYSLASNRKITGYNLSNTSIEKAGEGAFSECDALVNIVLPQSLKELGKRAFYKCSNLGVPTSTGAARLVDLSKTQLEEIPEACFQLCSALNRIKLPSVKTISSKAFYNSGITSIDLPKSIENISDDAFRACKKLEEIAVEGGNVNYVIQSNALYTYDMKKLVIYPASCKETEFSINGNTEVICAYAFQDAINLTKVDLSSVNIVEIPTCAFMNCINIKTLTITKTASKGIKKIGARAFQGCRSLTEFDGGYSITEIGESAFKECVNITTVGLLEDTLLTKIGEEAFMSCTKLNTLTLPTSTVLTIGARAFSECDGIKTLTYEGNNQSFLDILARSPECGLEKYKDLVIH